MKFQKSNPNPFAFAPLNYKTYEIAGTIKHRPVDTAILSRLVAGVAYSDRSYTTTTGREMVVGRGWTWASIRTLRQDYSSATGCKISRQNVLTAIKRLTNVGLLVDSKLALPETKGRYGKLFRLSDNSLKSEGDMIDVLREHRLFTYGDVKDYRYSGKRVEYAPEEFTREVFGDHRTWIKRIAADGMDTAGYITTGNWRFGDVGNPDANVFVPWIVVDIDRKSYPDAHADTITAIGDFESVGFDEKSMFVSFSGSKGFHILLSTARLGHPIFKSSVDCTEIVAELLRSWTDVNFDTSTCNPLQVYRITGSRNFKSGLYKRTYTIGDFYKTSLAAIYENAKLPGKWVWPESMLETEAEMVDALRSSANAVLKSRIGRRYNKSKFGYNKIGKTIGAIIAGIEEGENFMSHHEGRNKAAYILSCFMLEHPEQLRQVRDRLGVNGRHDFDNPDLAFVTLEHWYNKRADKGTHPVKLIEPFRSAQRTIARKYGR